MQKYPSPTDITEMKAKGFEPQTIEVEEEKGLRWYAAERVRENIREAFKDVKLGNGTGLKEANGLDDRADAVQLATFRATDEKEDWQRISVDSLNYYFSSPGFFDAEGMRFHLPALMIAYLNGDYIHELTSRLTDIGEHNVLRFSLLSQQQRMAVRDYLVLLAEIDEIHYLPKILRALEEYWTDQSD